MFDSVIENAVRESRKNIKIDKVTVWDNGNGGGNGKTSTANFLSGLMQSVPPLEEVFALSGLTLPEFLGKKAEEKTEAAEENNVEPLKAEILEPEK